MVSFFFFSLKHYGYLVEEFSYTVKDKRYTANPLSDGVIEFVSSKTIIEVQKDRNAFIVSLKPANEPEVSRMSLPWILEALNIKKSDSFPGEVAPEGYDKVLRENAELLRKYCLDIVQGDFSRWLDILQYFVDQSKRGYRSRTGRELPKRVHQDREDYIKSKSLS